MNKCDKLTAISSDDTKSTNNANEQDLMHWAEYPVTDILRAEYRWLHHGSSARTLKAHRSYNLQVIWTPRGPRTENTDSSNTINREFILQWLSTLFEPIRQHGYRRFERHLISQSKTRMSTYGTKLFLQNLPS